MADEGTLPTPAIDPSNCSLPGDQPLCFAQGVVLVIIVLIISITGIIGNSIVILAIVLSCKLRSTLNWFILNLACADLLTSIIILFGLANLLISNDLISYFIFFGTIGCVGVSLTNHAFICFTTWYHISRNQDKFKELYKARNVCLMIAFTWVFNFSSLCLYFILLNENSVFVLALSIFGHFAIVVTVYLKLWRFIAHRAEKMKPKKKIEGKIQNEICTDAIGENQVTQQGGLVNENTILRTSNSTEHLESQNCDKSKGERLKSGQPDNRMQDAKTVTVSPTKEDLKSTDGESDLRAIVPLGIEGSETKLPVKKQTQPKIDKKLLAVTKNLLVILVAFVICFIPFAVTLCLALSYSAYSYSALPWFYALLLFNSCINPIIYARRIRAFREVMVCIIRCRLGSIPMPIDLVRKMRTTR